MRSFISWALFVACCVPHGLAFAQAPDEPETGAESAGQSPGTQDDPQPDEESDDEPTGAPQAGEQATEDDEAGPPAGDEPNAEAEAEPAQAGEGADQPETTAAPAASGDQSAAQRELEPPAEAGLEAPDQQQEQPAIPSPGELGDRLQQGPGDEVVVEDEWTAPQPVLTLHGYFRVRGELQDTFWLGRAAPLGDPPPPDPFTPFRSLERMRRPDMSAEGDSDCAGEGLAGGSRVTTSGGMAMTDRGCDIDTLSFANLRLRLSPQLNLSEDVRVHTTFDILDNLVAGSTGTGFYGTGSPAASRGVTAGTVVPPEEQDLGDSIKVRRAWAEVRNRGLGELRFGRMPNHWGLGILNHAGNRPNGGLDLDFSSDIDRLMAITKIVGFYLTASYDFIAEGLVRSTPTPSGLPFDSSQLDDVDQYTFTASRRLTAEEQETVLERGEAVLNGGLYFSYRTQELHTNPPPPPDPTMPDEVLEPSQQFIGAESFTFDAWGQLRWGGLRVETEVVLRYGGIDALDTMVGAGPRNLDLRQLGYALETEYRLLDDKLGFYLDHGLASGDSDILGLSSDTDFFTQLDDDTVSTFRFHPNYRVDLILWRNIMRQVTGAYYLKPGLSYDFVRDPFGQLLGARINAVWSRSATIGQTWGGDKDLGLELNAQLYWRSEDGPEMEDGYHAKLQYGIFFPFNGLRDQSGGPTDLSTAQTLRLLLGVVF